MGKVATCVMIAAVGCGTTDTGSSTPGLLAEATVLCGPNACGGGAEPVHLPVGFKARVSAFHVFPDSMIVASDITWSSSPDSVIAFDGELRGVSPGAGTATATHALDGTRDDLAIHVHPLRSVAITPRMGTTIQVGGRIELVVMGDYGSTMDGVSFSGPYDLRGSTTDSIVLTSGDSAIASIEPSQLVRGVAPGQTTITATFAGMSDSVGVTVE